MDARELKESRHKEVWQNALYFIALNLLGVQMSLIGGKYTLSPL